MGPSHLGYLRRSCLLEVQMIFVSAALLVLGFFLLDLPGPLCVCVGLCSGVVLFLSQ